MKKIFLAWMVATATLASPLWAQGSDSEQSSEKKATNGMGFVVSSGMGARLKSNELYYRDGKSFKKIRLSGRNVSDRVRVRGGKIEIWDSDPTPATPDAAVAPPLVSIEVPSGVGSRPVCLVLPYKDKNGKVKARAMVLNESVVPSTGQHIVNLSGYPLTVTIATKSDFSDRKDTKIAPNRQGGRSVTPDNIFSLKGADGSVRAFMLSATLQSGKPPVRLRASRFVLSTKQGQVTLVFKDPTRAGVKMESIVVPAPQKPSR